MAAAALLAGEARAGLRSTEDLQYWAPTFVHAPTPARFLGLLELNPRARGDLGRLNQLLVRPWLGYALSPRLDLHAGYAWVRNDTGRVTQEHRAWQQATAKASALRARWALRARLEQRWLEDVPSTAWRGRLMLRAERPLRAGPWYLAASNELFVHLAAHRRGPPDGLDQNRLYAGAGRRTGGRGAAELGYQHWWLRRVNAPDSVFHVLVLTTQWDPANL